MTLAWLRRHRLSVTVAAALLIITVLVGIGVKRDDEPPLERDCAMVLSLARQMHEDSEWADDGLSHSSDPDEIVERKSALSDKLLAAAQSAKTSELKQPLTVWADAMALNARLQREGNAMNGDDMPPREWVAGAQQYNTMTVEALNALDQHCPGVKQTVYGR